MKKLLSIALLAFTVFSLASCQLSTLRPPVVTTAPGQPQTPASTPAETTGSTPSVPETPTFDFMGADLAQYVTLGEYKGIKITDVSTVVTDEMVDRYVDEILVSNDFYEKVTSGTLAEYDIVSMSYVGKKDGVAFETGTANNVAFLVSEKDYICGFEDRPIYVDGFAAGMIGKPIGEAFDIQVTFPEDYGVEEMKGAQVTFTITVHHVCKASELSQGIVTKLENADTTPEKYVELKKEELIEGYNSVSDEVMSNELCDKIYENATFLSLPTEYVDGLYNAEYSAAETLASMYGMNVEDVLKIYGYASKEALRTEIEEYVKMSMIRYQIVKAENLTVSDDEYKERLDELAKANESTAEEIEKAYGKETILEVFIFEKVNEFVYAAADLVKPEASAQ